MNLKRVTARLKNLKDRIDNSGLMTDEDEASLRDILEETMRESAKGLNTAKPFSAFTPIHADNDNTRLNLTPDQEARLSIVEKTGTGSRHIH